METPLEPSDALHSIAKGGKMFKMYSLDQLLVLKVLGTGSFASVRQVVHRDTGEVFALKVAKRSAAVRSAGSEEKAQTLLQREVDLQLSLRHPNIVELHSHFEDDQAVYSLQEYVGGGSLYSFMRRKGRLTEVAAAPFFTDVAEGLDYLHGRRIIHRDVKPENILLTHDFPQQAKITDFGCSAKVSADEPERRTICGTMDYLAPEMICMEPHDHTIDVWAVGVLLYEMLVAAPPFAAPSQTEAFKRISEADLRCPDFLSPSSKDLLRALLRRERILRLPLSDALKHGWVSEHRTKVGLGNSNRGESNNSRTSNTEIIDLTIPQGHTALDSTEARKEGTSSRRLRSLTPENYTRAPEILGENVQHQSGADQLDTISPLASPRSSRHRSAGGYPTQFHLLPPMTTSPSNSTSASKGPTQTQETVKPLLAWSLGRDEADSADLSPSSPCKPGASHPTSIPDEISDAVPRMSSSSSTQIPDDRQTQVSDTVPRMSSSSSTQPLDDLVLDEVSDTKRWMSELPSTQPIEDTNSIRGSATKRPGLQAEQYVPDQSSPSCSLSQRQQPKECRDLQSTLNNLLEKARGIAAAETVSHQDLEVSAVVPVDEIARIPVPSQRTLKEE